MIGDAGLLNPSTSTSATTKERRITTVAKNPERGILRKHARGRFSPANIAREKSMTFTKHASNRRSRAQIRRLHRAEPHPIQDLRRGHGRALVLSVPQHDDARVRPAPPAWSSLTVEAATTLSYCVGHALPALLLGILSWAVAEILAGFAAYAEAMHAPPVVKGPVPAETDDADLPGGAKPSRSFMTLQVNDGSAGHGNQAQPGVRAAALPTEWSGERQGARTDWRVSLAHVAGACQSSLRRARHQRRAIEELRSLDDRSLRDIGISRCDIEHIARYGVRRE
jgi:uncharacterized protein YjiS (DUF1127 family)